MYVSMAYFKSSWDYKCIKSYKSDKVLEVVRVKEFRLPSGKRIDYIEFEKKIIYELKPYNLEQWDKVISS